MNNRVSRIKFPTLLMQWEGKKQVAAYIAAERQIIFEASRGNDLTGADALVRRELEDQGMNPEEFWTSSSTEFVGDPFGGIKNVSELDRLYNQALEIREQINRAINDEEYEVASVLQRTLDVLEMKYNNLK